MPLFSLLQTGLLQKAKVDPSLCRILVSGALPTTGDRAAASCTSGDELFVLFVLFVGTAEYLFH